MPRRQRVRPEEPALRGGALPVGPTFWLTRVGSRTSVLLEAQARAVGPYALQRDGRTHRDGFPRTSAREGGCAAQIASEGEHPGSAPRAKAVHADLLLGFGALKEGRPVEQQRAARKTGRDGVRLTALRWPHAAFRVAWSCSCPGEGGRMDGGRGQGWRQAGGARPAARGAGCWRACSRWSGRPVVWDLEVRSLHSFCCENMVLEETWSRWSCDCPVHAHWDPHPHPDRSQDERVRSAQGHHSSPRLPPAGRHPHEWS